MNQEQQNTLETHERTHEFLTRNTVIWNKYTPLTNPVRDLGTSIQDRKKAATTQQTKTEGATAGKNNAHKKAIETVVWISNLANAYALATNNTDLYAQTARSKSYIRQLPDEQGVAVMKQMLAAITPHMTPLVPYGISAADLTAAQNAVAAADTQLTAPRTVVDSKKTAGQGIAPAERTGRASLKLIDKLILYFEKTNPEFVRNYFNTRVKIDRRGGGGGTQSPTTP